MEDCKHEHVTGSTESKPKCDDCGKEAEIDAGGNYEWK